MQISNHSGRIALSISVVIPVLNNVQGFDRALHSVLTQAFPVQVIVIDGGSSDGTLDCIRHNETNIAYWETGLDSGIADAFNRGIAKATGDIVAILNSDDYWEPDTLDHLYQALQTDSDADLYCGAMRYHDSTNDYSYTRRPSLINISRQMSLFHPSIFVAKKCYECLGGYSEVYTHAMDAEWCHRAINQQKDIVLLGKVLSNMSLGGVSDRESKVSLKQYRDSLIKHNICHPVKAYWYYAIHRFQKMIMKNRCMQMVKRFRDGWILQH